MSVAAIVLAAGFSRRLGRPKQEVVLGGKTLLARSVRTAQEAGLTPVLVVLRPEQERLASSVRELGAVLAIHPLAHEGMATSVKCGVQAAEPFSLLGAVLMTCDQPGLTAAHLRALTMEPGRVTASTYGGQNGVPAYFPRTALSALLQLHGDRGARELLRDAVAVQDEALAVDVDTEEDIRLAQRTFGP